MLRLKLQGRLHNTLQKPATSVQILTRNLANQQTPRRKVLLLKPNDPQLVKHTPHLTEPEVSSCYIKHAHTNTDSDIIANAYQPR